MNDSFIEKHMKQLFIVPLVLLLLFLTIFPTIYNYFLSVHQVSLATFRDPNFIGLTNFIKTLTHKDFYNALFFSLKFSLITTFFELIIGLSMALLLRKNVRGKKIIISLLLVPMMISPALIGIMFRLMLHEFIGYIAYYLNIIGLAGSNLLTPQYIFLTFIGIDILQWSSFVFIILYSALQTVPEELYEAALVDGANTVQKFFYITLPTIYPFVIIAVFLRWIDSFKVFDLINVMSGGGPGTITTSISIYIYKMAFKTGDFGRAAAASVILLFLLSIPLGLALKQINRKR